MFELLTLKFCSSKHGFTKFYCFIILFQTLHTILRSSFNSQAKKSASQIQFMKKESVHNVTIYLQVTEGKVPQNGTLIISTRYI